MIALWTILSSLAAALLAFQQQRACRSMGACRVLEREAHLAYHSSGRSAALYEENYGSPSTIALAKAGRADWEDLLDGRA